MHPNLPLSQVKITPFHLERKAVIYIRQSSPKQVREHLDSQLTQRALVGRDQSLGWHPERIAVFDGDLGQSATGLHERDDFKALAAEIALGHVGVVFGWQVSRLARNNAEWYQLLDLAALFDTLIGDTDGLYDPRLEGVSKVLICYPRYEDERQRNSNTRECSHGSSSTSLLLLSRHGY